MAFEVLPIFPLSECVPPSLHSHLDGKKRAGAIVPSWGTHYGTCATLNGGGKDVASTLTNDVKTPCPNSTPGSPREAPGLVRRSWILDAVGLKALSAGLALMAVAVALAVEMLS
ncbi:threonylcarbamoyladenosine tRNA methylthiotransferase [Arapaima gigas]